MAVTAESVQNFIAPCFSPVQKVNCEVSGVVRSGAGLILVNDKRMPTPAGSAVFTMQLKDEQAIGSPTYLENQTLSQADKYEALTTTLDGKFVIASTAFNKEGTSDNPGLDVLNTLVYWPVMAPDQAKVLSPSTRGGITSSRELREKIFEAIDLHKQQKGSAHSPATSYLQVEALTTTPEGNLLIGIRKYGQDSKTATFTFLLLSVSLNQHDGELMLGDALKVVLDLTPDKLARKLGLPDGSLPELGLSGIEFDRYNNDRFYAVTSFEKGDVLGGYLWMLPLEKGAPGKPQPVRGKDGAPIKFANKPEGVEVLDQHRVLVVHDDDRVKVKDENGGVRKDYEFTYSVINLAPTQ
ncbi:hypothetical protein [Pseudomonas soli]|uniref:hypothetical protein n=1 Tax=Pseudomonas soli TaxID=1306993 RepID=UPI003DA875D7